MSDLPKCQYPNCTKTFTKANAFSIANKQFCSINHLQQWKLVELDPKLDAALAATRDKQVRWAKSTGGGAY